MAIKEVRCYNKALNKYKYFNDNILTEDWMRRSGYYPVPEAVEEPILSEVIAESPVDVSRETPAPKRGRPSTKTIK